MSVVLSIKDLGPCRKEVTVEVPAPAVEAETQRVEQEYGRAARLPGFRRGKVPAQVVRRRFAKEIQQEVLERLVPRYWRQAQAESQLDPMLPPEVGDLGDWQPGSPLTFVATVDTRPAIELRNVRDFALPEPSTTVGPDEVDHAIEELRLQAASWPEVARPAGQGDRVAVEVTELGGEGDGQPQAVEVEIGDPRVWEELSVAVTGLQAGQEIRFERRPVAPPPAAAAAGTAEAAPAPPAAPRRFTARVSAVKERQLPPVDDALAQRLGDFPDLPALRQEVEARLRTGKVSERRERRRQAVLDQLRDRHPSDLPQRVVDHEVEGLLRDYAESMARRGVDLEHIKLDWNQLAAEARPQAERRVHARLLLDAVAGQEDITVSESELEQALAVIARAQGKPTAAVRQALDQAGRLGALRAQLRRDKALGRLIGEEATVAQSVAELTDLPADHDHDHDHDEDDDHHGHSHRHTHE